MIIIITSITDAKTSTKKGQNNVKGLQIINCP